MKSHRPPQTVEELQSLIVPKRLPRHVAIIMDGNGRWAEMRGLPRVSGHREGIQSLRDIVEVCGEVGLPVLTIYAFSLENWRRPRQEIAELMRLLEHYLEKELETLLKNKIRFRTIGELNHLSDGIVAKLRDAQRRTETAESRMTLNVALSYGSRYDIVQAARRLVEQAERGELRHTMVNEALFSNHLSTAGLPDPDLMIRTSGEARISNFLLWELAYTELYFTRTLWPDFRRREMLLALLDYQQRERRFGQVMKPQTA